MSFRDTSEETEQLCDHTINLMKSFQDMLQSAKTNRRSEAPICPCGRSHCSQRPQPHQQQQANPTVCSNVSNLVSNQGRVLTSPSEIRLLLRLETWLGDNGVLVVKPSVHREEECGGAGNNNTGANRPAALKPAQNHQPHQQRQASSSETMEDGAGDCCDEADEEDTAEIREPQHRRLQQLMPKSTATPAASKPRQQQQHRRERLLVKRPASVAAVSRTVGARTRRETEPAGGAPSERVETMSLIRKLHRLLSVELKRPAAADE